MTLIYIVSERTKEFLGEIDVKTPPVGAITEKVPPVKADTARIFTNGSWKYIADYRDKHAFNINTKAPTAITELGPLPVDLTMLEPPSEYAEWVGDHWSTTTPGAIEKVKSAVKKSIDEAAAEVYHKYSRFEMEYLTREAQARAYLADPLTDNVSFVSSVATAAKITFEAASRMIVAEADAARAAMDKLQELRMLKLSVSDSDNTENMLLLRKNVLAGIKEIGDLLE